jgi:hemerythrin superfamily protein
MADHTSVIEELQEDHEAVKRAFAQIESADQSQWWGMFTGLVSDLVRHEVAEEEIVYPVVRKQLPDGDALADARIKEQSESEELLKQMEKKGANAPDFPANLAILRDSVLRHAQAEEILVFAPLAAALDEETLAKMGDRYEKAKATAPTHPHPSAPDTPPGNMALGPVTAIVDRARDGMRSVP